MPTGKNHDDVREQIEIVLEHNGVAPTYRLVEDLRRIVVLVAAQEKSRITEQLIMTQLKRIGLLK